MAGDCAALSRQEARLARRLCRLFRAERSGRTERWHGPAADGLRTRRGRLIDELLALEAARRAAAPGLPAELAQAMRALAQEVGCAEAHCLQRLAEIEAELRRRRGVTTGLRDGGGRVLGRV